MASCASNKTFYRTENGTEILVNGAIDEWRELRGAACGLAEPQADAHDGADGTRAGAPGDRVHAGRRPRGEHLLVGGGVGAQREAQRDRAPAAAAPRHRELPALRGTRTVLLRGWTGRRDYYDAKSEH